MKGVRGVEELQDFREGEEDFLKVPKCNDNFTTGPPKKMYLLVNVPDQ